MVALQLFAGTTALLALIQLWTIGLGLARVGMTRSLAAAGLAVAVAGAVAFGLVGRWSTDEPEAEPSPRHARVLSWLLAAVALGWLGWLWTQAFTIAWFRDPMRWDELWYHVPAIHEWVRRGYVYFYPLDPRFAQVPDQVWFAGWLDYPMGVELTSFFGFFLLGSDRLIDGTNLWYWPMGVTALAVIARTLGARDGWPWLAGALLCGWSEFLSQSATGYVDPGFNCAVLAAVAAGVVFVFTRAGPAWWSAVLFGAAAGLMAGAKGHGIPFAGLLFVVAVGVKAWRAGRRTWTNELRQAGVVLGILIAVGGYWSLRNLVNTGNPIYPIGLQFGHKVLAEGYDLTAYDTAEWVLDDYPFLKPYSPWARMIVAWTQPDLRFRRPVDLFAIRHSTAAGLGYLWIAGGVPAILLLWSRTVRGRDRRRLAPLGFLTAVMVLFLFAVTFKWEARSTYWLHALGLPALAVVFGESVARVRRNGWHLPVIVVGTAVLGVGVWESRQSIALERRLGAESNDTGRRYRQPLDYRWAWMRTAEGFREMIDADRVVRSTWSTPGTEIFNGVLALPLGRREIAILPPEPTDHDLDDLVRRGFRWVVWHLAEGRDLPEVLVRRAGRIYEGPGGYRAVDLAAGVGG